MVKRADEWPEGLKGLWDELEGIAAGGAAEHRFWEASGRREAKRARGENVTAEEDVEWVLAAHDAGRIPADAAVWFLARVLEAKVAEPRIQEAYSRRFSDRFTAIRKEHGLGPDEYWSPGEGPPEYEALNEAFEAMCREIEAEVLREQEKATGHALVREAAELCGTDRLAFDRQVERGRQWFHGPPDAEMAKYLRAKGIID